MQAGDASGTGLFDTANRTYDSKRLGSIDSNLEDKFPQLIGPNEVRAITPKKVTGVTIKFGLQHSAAHGVSCLVLEMNRQLRGCIHPADLAALLKR